VKRELDRIPQPFFAKIDRAIQGLHKNPRPFGVKKLEENLHRIRIGDWRVIYAIFDPELKVVILRIARRTEKTYKGLHP
jgi:mRNA interferase RelE/StbE